MWETVCPCGCPSLSFPTPLPQQGARVFGALGPIGPSSPGLTLGGLVVGEHRLSNKLLAWSGVLEWQEVRAPGQVRGWGRPVGPACPCRWAQAWAPGLCPETLAPAAEAPALLGLQREAEAHAALPGLREPGREPVSAGRAAGRPGAGAPLTLSSRRETDQWPQKLIMQLIPQQLLVRPTPHPWLARPLPPAPSSDPAVPLSPPDHPGPPVPQLPAGTVPLHQQRLRLPQGALPRHGQRLREWAGGRGRRRAGPVGTLVAVRQGQLCWDRPGRPGELPWGLVAPLLRWASPAVSRSERFLSVEHSEGVYLPQGHEGPGGGPDQPPGVRRVAGAQQRGAAGTEGGAVSAAEWGWQWGPVQGCCGRSRGLSARCVLCKHQVSVWDSGTGSLEVKFDLVPAAPASRPGSPQCPPPGVWLWEEAGAREGWA